MKSPVAATAMAAALFGCVLSVSAQYSLPAASKADIETAYTSAIEKRSADIIASLAITDEGKSNKVRDLLLTNYRDLRARDEAIDAKLKEPPKAGSPAPDRNALFESMSKPLHDQFLTKLSAELTPDQVDKVKDKLTYGKVKVTYDAYNDIIPGLKDADKEKIMTWLKQAREEAMDGGSAKEKSDIFQKYKNKINDYLNANGHDVDKAYKDWNAKQEAVKKQASAADVKPAASTQ